MDPVGQPEDTNTIVADGIPVELLNGKQFSTPVSEESFSESLSKITDALNKADHDKVYHTYLALRTRYHHLPVLYITTACKLFDLQLTEQAIRVISTLAELETETPSLLRSAA